MKPTAPCARSEKGFRVTVLESSLDLRHDLPQQPTLGQYQSTIAPCPRPQYLCLIAVQHRVPRYAYGNRCDTPHSTSTVEHVGARVHNGPSTSMLWNLDARYFDSELGGWYLAEGSHGQERVPIRAVRASTQKIRLYLQKVHCPCSFGDVFDGRVQDFHSSEAVIGSGAECVMIGGNNGTGFLCYARGDDFDAHEAVRVLGHFGPKKFVWVPTRLSALASEG
eukprot:1137738-Rhodomonas_salina.1